jgi:hypothetical protein
MKRWIAAILGVCNTANGLVMLFASSTWWGSVPGVSETGAVQPAFRPGRRCGVPCGRSGASCTGLGLQLGRMFPMIKYALGYAKECRRVSVAGDQIDVVKQAA